MIKKGKAFIKLEKEIENRINNGEESISYGDLKKMMSDISYEQFQKRMGGEEVADILSDYVNSSFGHEDNEFVNTVLSDHRTLQQSMFRLFYKCIQGWAVNYKNDRYDPRNEATCEMSEKMVEATSEHGIPLI